MNFQATSLSNKSLYNVWYIALLVSTITIYGLSLFLPIHPDELVFTNVASEINLGKILYQEVIDHKPPGIYYIAALINLFSSKIYFYRLIQFLVVAVNACVLFFISQKIYPHIASSISSVVYLLLAPIYQGAYFLTEVWMTALMLMSIMAFVYWIKTQYYIGAMIAGSLAACALLFKQPALTIAVIEIFLISQLATKILVSLISYLIGFSFIITLTLFFFWNQGSMSGLLDNILIFNFTNYPPHHLLETITQLPTVLGFGGIIIGIGSLSLFQLSKYSPHKLLLIIYLALLPFCLYRPYHHYWLMLLPLTSLGFAKWWTSSHANAKLFALVSISIATSTLLLSTLIQLATQVVV